MKMKNEIILFDRQDVKLEVNMTDETVWLTQNQMSELFDRDVKTISKHIINTFNEELDEKSNSHKMRIANSDKLVNIYNLDVIISVGYRVKSKNGIIFRKWANKILKDYMLKGCAINQQRLDYLEKKVKLIDIAGKINDKLNSDEAQGIIKVISGYSNALNLLDDYDHKKIIKPKGMINNRQITYDECINIIKKLRFNNDSDLFAVERDKGLQAIINDLYQTFDDKYLYPTVEEQAANFLYLIIKNHVFIDGNKRIAATLFIYFLDFNDILYKDNKKLINNDTLVAITLLIAQSNPKEKSILIDLVMNFLNK
jgi:death-on-curing family protein